MQHWQSMLPNPLLTVQLTDWVEDFDGTLRRVLEPVRLHRAAATAPTTMIIEFR